MLVGRQRDLGQIREALDQHRMATLVGPGGVGKTTLARALVEEYPADSVFFASLASLDGPELAEAAAGQFGFASFAEFLELASSEQWLIVLDNCEHVLDAAADLADAVLAATAKTRILATSRERLEVDDERVVRLDPCQPTARRHRRRSCSSASPTSGGPPTCRRRPRPAGWPWNTSRNCVGASTGSPSPSSWPRPGPRP